MKSEPNRLLYETLDSVNVGLAVLDPQEREAAVRERQARWIADSTVQRQLVKAGTRILVVEDNTENQILLRAYLEGAGFLLAFAGNGVEGVVQRKQGAWDLILMDIQMPVMDGYTATREIRAWERSQRVPPVPILALTAHALSGASEESAAAGCDGHLTKPIERDDLIRAIAKYARKPPERPASVADSIQALRPVYLSSRQRDLVKMQAALASGDFPAIQSIGHDCKGTGTGYGFPEISRIGSAVEMAAKKQDKEEVIASIRDFEQCLANAGSG